MHRTTSDICLLVALLYIGAVNELSCSRAAQGSDRVELVQARLATQTNELELTFQARSINETSPSYKVLG